MDSTHGCGFPSVAILEISTIHEGFPHQKRQRLKTFLRINGNPRNRLVFFTVDRGPFGNQTCRKKIPTFNSMIVPAN